MEDKNDSCFKKLRKKVNQALDFNGYSKVADEYRELVKDIDINIKNIDLNDDEIFELKRKRTEINEKIIYLDNKSNHSLLYVIRYISFLAFAIFLFYEVVLFINHKADSNQILSAATFMILIVEILLGKK